MKVILYMAITPNGFIARKDDDTDWVTKIEWDSFRKTIKRIGNMVIGRRTYEIMKTGGEFAGLEDIKIVVVAHKPKTDDQDVSFATSHRQALKLLETQRFKEALVCGGGKLNGTFMQAGLVDEIYLDIEPTVFGQGIPIFGDTDFTAKLQLVETEKLSDNEIRLHYQVLR